MRAIILAAGRGTRMRPLTDHIPKPLLCIGGVPLIVHHLHHLARAGVHDIIINLGHLGEKIEETVGNGHLYGVNIRYSYEDPILETGGGIAKALPWLGPDPFIAVSGDVLTDFPFSRLTIGSDKLAHLVLVDNPPYHFKGDYALQSGIVSAEGTPLLNFAGIGLYRPELFQNCPKGAFQLSLLFKSAFASQAITGEYYSGFWHNIGTPEQLESVEHIFSKHINNNFSTGHY
jgi:MurNAc alpha-1-phosphate uridylyltransferase